MKLEVLVADDHAVGKPVMGLPVMSQGAALVLLAVLFTLLADDDRRPRLTMDGPDVGHEVVHGAAG